MEHIRDDRVDPGVTVRGPRAPSGCRAGPVLNLSPLLIAGLLLEPWPGIDARQAVLIAWLALFNTALAFLLWNGAMRHLTATETGLINNAMLPQIAILSWVSR